MDLAGFFSNYHQRTVSHATALFIQAEATWAFTVLGYLAKFVLGILG